MGAIVTAYDLDPNDIADALHTLADDIEDESATVVSAADGVSADSDDGPVEISIELDAVISDEATFQNLIDLSNV